MINGMYKHPVRFMTQRVICNYIVDFYCVKVKIVIDLDDSQHYEEQTEVYDLKITEYLEKRSLIYLLQCGSIKRGGTR